MQLVANFLFAVEKATLQIRIVNAIAQRELRLRAAAGVMGVAGVFIEPLVGVITFMLLRLLIGAKGGYINPILNLSLGFIPFFMFSDVAIKALGGVAKNSKLYFYRRIKPLDAMLGDAFLTTQVYGILMFSLYLGISLWEWNFSILSLGLMTIIFMMISLFGLGVGLNSLILGHRMPLVAWFVKMTVRRVLLWTSCVFFPISLIPDQFRIWVLWNPLAHGIELMRHSVNPAYPIPGVSPAYFAFGTIVLVFFSFLIYGNNEELLMSDES
jgi:capsular polysaccharide transport system permease protein